MINRRKFWFLYLMTNMVLSTARAQGPVKEDFRPSEVNQPGKQFPQVNSEGRVRVQIEAPDAQYVKLDIGGVKYNLTRKEKGIWIGESAPQEEGFTTTSSTSTGHQCRIPEHATSTVPDAGAAESRSLRMISRSTH